MKFFARKGAVGGTARVVGKYYKHYRELHPDKDKMPDPVIYRLIITGRYKALKNKAHEDLLLEQAGSMRGLKDLVISILCLEGGYGENTSEIKMMFEEVIVEELIKQGVSKHEVW